MNFIKKKVNVFGKGIPVLAIFVLGLAVVSAALVGYLSGMVTGEVEVKSPMVAGISLGAEDGSWSTTQCLNTDPNDPKFNEMVDCYPAELHTLDDWTTGKTPLTLPVMYTGQEKTFTLYTMSENIADVHIWGFEEAIVTNPLGVTCADFASVIVRVDSINGGIGYGTPKDLIALGACHSITGSSGTQVQFGGGSSDWNVGETDVSEMVVTFNNVLGTYTFTYQIIPEE